MDLLVISTFCKRKGRLHRHVERGPLNKIEMTGTKFSTGFIDTGVWYIWVGYHELTGLSPNKM